MLLTITTTHRPATDLGYLLHKNPTGLHEIELSFGRAHAFYPEACEDRCTFALVLDVDPVALVRGKPGGQGGPLDQYVNDRPYAASSLLSVAIARALGTALGGRSREREDLARTPIPLTATITPLPVRGDEDLVGKLFTPLSYAVEATSIPLDETMPAWGASPYVRLTLSATCRLKDLLTHLYVLIPVLDRRKHYFIAEDEIEKLLAKGEGWLAAHPEKEMIVRRYLWRKRSLAQEALARLIETDETAPATEVSEGPEVETAPKDAAEEALEKPIRLHDQRLDTVTGVLKRARAKRVLDLGCGDGKLLRRLLAEKQFEDIVGVDVSIVSLERAGRRLKLDRMPERQRARIRLLQGALTYRDKRIEGYDAAALVEVIEHLDIDRLAAMERVVFEFARPGVVVVTTPNREYNARFAGLAPGQLRHADHRFEWTRAEFRGWAEPAAERFGYRVAFSGVGEEDAALGAPSQMAVFERG